MKMKRVNIEELNAVDKLYGNGINKKRVIKICFLPALFVAFSLFIVFYNPIITFIGFVFGGIFGYFSILERLITYQYEEKAFQERNRAITTLTQILVDKEKTMTLAISTAKSRAYGELKNDLELLESRLLNANREGIKKAFNELNKKYEKDIIFTQYLEQLETSINEGRVNIDTLKDISDYHSLVYEEQKDFTKKKQERKRDLFQMIGIMFVFVLAVSFSFGFETYLSAYAHTIIGYVSGGLFLGLNYFWIYRFTTYFFDSSVTDVKL